MLNSKTSYQELCAVGIAAVLTTECNLLLSINTYLQAARPGKIQ